MRHIVSLSIGSSAHSGESILDLGQEKIRLTRLGADHDPELLLSWIQKMDGHSDVIALNDLPPPIKIGRKVFRHELLTLIGDKTSRTPVTTGNLMHGMASAWALDQALADGRIRLDGSSVTMLSSLWQHDIVKLLETRVAKIHCLDPWTFLGLPLAFEGHGNLEAWAARFIPWLKKDNLAPCPRRTLTIAARWAPTMRLALMSEVMIVHSALVDRIDPQILRGKVVLVNELTPEVRLRLEAAQVNNAHALHLEWRSQDPGLGEHRPPSPSPSSSPSLGVRLSGAELEALLMLTRGHDEPLTLDEVVQWVVEGKIEAKVESLFNKSFSGVQRFAFVVHPLSRTDLFRHPILRPLGAAPLAVQKLFEKGVALGPGIRYGTLRGVVSQASGVEVEGMIYGLFATPREMLAADPQLIYDRLVAVAEHAAARGAKILGLGAFTKIVGDAGVTVAERSPIPVTTGNSLSAASTLWAARDVCKKLGFVTFDPARKARITGRAMVIGATGSIGKVCAKIMSQLFSEIVFAATNAYRLMQLSREIQAETPHVDIKVTTQPDRFAPGCDLIVIATSATEGGVLDIKAIKPGCVVCDVSRPLTFTAEEAMTRPDVMIIESGEIELPGPVQLDCDIGLEDSVVYACLAETAILAMEQRFESFTLSRNIHTRKVIEIYKMAKKHGAKLAEIRGPCGLVTDAEIDLCREHAEKKLGSWSVNGSSGEKG